MTQDFHLETYITEGVEGLVRDMTKISSWNPKASLFMMKYASASKQAMARRNAATQRGEHVPPFLIASITSQCNLHCQGCYARARDLNGCGDEEAESQLSDLEWLGIFREAESLGIGFILVAGGEPLLRRELIEGLGAIPQIVFPIFTNGTLLDADYLKLFDKYRNLVPILSIEGLSESTDERRGTGIFEQMRQGMERMNRKSIFFGVSITVHKDNLQESFSPALLGNLSALGCKAVIYVEYVPVDHKAKPGALTDLERERMEAEMGVIRDKYPGMLFISFPGDEKESGGCLAAGRGFFHINFDGSAEPCPFAPHSDANIRNMTLMEAMASPLFQRLRESDILMAEHTGGCVLFGKQDEIQEILNGPQGFQATTDDMG